MMRDARSVTGFRALRETHIASRFTRLIPFDCTQPQAMVISKVSMAVIVGDLLLTA
jgi:hypothetical protein